MKIRRAAIFCRRGDLIGRRIQQHYLKPDYSPNWYIRFNSRSLYSYSLSQLIDAGSAMVDRMAMTRNEWRDWIGIAPRSEMEELLALENYIPADRLGDQNKLTGGETNGG